MKKIILILLVAVATMANARNLTVKYSATSPKVIDETTRKAKMTLVSDGEHSLYYNEMSLYVDSLTSTPEGKKQLREIQMAAWVSTGPDGSITVNKSKGNAPDKQVYTYVEKDFPSASMTVYDRLASELCQYSEPFDEMQWELAEDSTRTVLGYQCILATTDYHGRRWNVWFTPEIPLQDGPWKFHGLPGLILSAEADNSPFSFTATEVGYTDSSVPTVYRKDGYDRAERRKALADHEYLENNIESQLASRGIKIVSTTSGKPRPKFLKERHAIETDY